MILSLIILNLIILRLIILPLLLLLLYLITLVILIYILPYNNFYYKPNKFRLAPLLILLLLSLPTLILLQLYPITTIFTTLNSSRRIYKSLFLLLIFIKLYNNLIYIYAAERVRVSAPGTRPGARRGGLQRSLPAPTFSVPAPPRPVKKNGYPLLINRGNSAY